MLPIIQAGLPGDVKALFSSWAKCVPALGECPEFGGLKRAFVHIFLFPWGEVQRLSCFGVCV